MHRGEEKANDKTEKGGVKEVEESNVIMVSYRYLKKYTTYEYHEIDQHPRNSTRLIDLNEFKDNDHY